MSPGLPTLIASSDELASNLAHLEAIRANPSRADYVDCVGFIERGVPDAMRNNERYRLMHLEERISAFRASISSNLLAGDDFIDWQIIDQQIVLNASAIAHVQGLVDQGRVTRTTLAQLLQHHPSTYPLLLDLIAFNSTGNQVEKWGLPQWVSADAARTDWVAGQLMHIGLDRILGDQVSVKALLRLAEVHKDSYRRRFRSAGRLEDRTRTLVVAAIQQASKALAQPVRIDPNVLADVQLRRSLSFTLAFGNRPIAGIATVFQNQSGGRQQRDLSVIYPNLQERLDAVGMSLILIADGQGLKEASDRTLNAMFEGVRYPMTLSAAESGALAEAITESSSFDAPKTIERTALEQLILDGLRSRLEVRAEDLPVTLDQARLALAYFVESRRRLAINLGANGDSVRWTNRGWIERARSLKAVFDSAAAVSLFAEILGVGEVETQKNPIGNPATLQAPPIHPFATKLHVVANSAPLSDERARDIAQRSMESAPGSPVAFYLTWNSLDASQIQTHRKAQIFLPTNIVVLSPGNIEDMARQGRPIERLMDALLAQSDLTKVSPYILNNATPSRMFYGREREAATVLQTITTNSVALLGSRRIGKTSLIRRLQEELSKARFQPFFGDCQTVRTWTDFADLARRNWQVELPGAFRPSHLDDMVAQLSSRGDGQVIIILDEIDQLLDWDQHHATDSVPEAFFRACRSLSQEGTAHFVFSGERRIANRLWDPQSPHWNFCREVQLTQLDEAAAISLLVDPLRAMNIEIIDPAAFERETWTRTSGHPQIVQFLGDRLVRLLDDRSDRRNLQLGAPDIMATTETFEFAEHYLETYWGQATAYEKAVSRVIAAGCTTSAEILTRLADHSNQTGTEALFGALRMLQLYGILKERDGQLCMRAEWFTQALAHFSG
jgi:AAA domain